MNEDAKENFQKALARKAKRGPSIKEMTKKNSKKEIARSPRASSRFFRRKSGSA